MDIRRFIFSRTPQARLARKVAAARAALFAEQLWAALLPALIAWGALAALLALGVFAWLPALLRLPLALALLGLGLWRLKGVLRLRWPTYEEGLARLERDSQLPHQPLRALHDTLAVPQADEQAQRLWQAHHARLQEALNRARPRWPRSPAPRRDPYALRFAVLLALIAGVALNGSEHLRSWPQLLRLPALASLAPGAPSTLDAWLDPPAFAGLPPIVLTRNGEALHQQQPLKVPGGTKLVVRFAGTSPPELQLVPLDGAGKTRSMTFEAAGDGQWKLQTLLRHPVQVRISAGWRSWRWRIAVQPDMPPRIAVKGEPKAAASGALMLGWQASDDHGLKQGTARAKLAAPLSGMLRFAPPEAPLKLPHPPQKQAQGEALLKWQAHPWAGLDVIITLQVQDVAQQTGQARLRLKLPERTFTKPLAQALIEQRRALVLHPEKHREIATVLAALIGWPEEMIRTSGQYLGIRHAALALYRARTAEDKKEIVHLLWQLAEDIEEGDLAAARRALQAAREALRQALRDGASPQEIERRMQKLREAMQRFLSALARQQGQQPPHEMARNGQVQTIRPQDLQQMLHQIEELARSGARQQAEQLLSQLDRMLENLQTMPQMAAPPSREERALGQMRQLMQRQQQLMDETWASAPPVPQDGPQGKQGQQGGMSDLQRRQEELARQMQQLRDQLGPQAGEALKHAEEAMKGAGQALGRGEKRTALQRQRQALDAMRQAARELARQVARQRGMGGGGVRFGGRRYDPLGRPLRGQFADPGTNTRMVPSGDAAQRARQILEQLRRRAEDATRPLLERNYIERLLKGLF